MAHRHRADIVYSGRLRWYLIIFAPHTLVLDQRTCSSGTPLPQLLPQRSENFTWRVNIHHDEQTHHCRSEPAPPSCPVKATAGADSLRPSRGTSTALPFADPESQHNSCVGIWSILCHPALNHAIKSRLLWTR